MKKSIGTLLIFISALFWGTAGLFVNTLRDLYGIKEIGIIFGRAFFTVIQLGIFMIMFDKKLFRIKLKDIWLFAITGIGSITFFNFCYYKTMAYTNLSVAAVLMYTAPIFVMIISIFFLKEKINPTKIICCLLAVVGVAFVSGAIGSSGGITAKGLIYGLLTGFGYSLFGIFSSVLTKKGYSAYTINFYSFIFVLISSGLILSDNFVHTIRLYTVSYNPIIVIFSMALLNTVIPYICYSSGLKVVSPSIAIIIATVEPVVAMIIDIMLGHTPTMFEYIGIVIVLFAVLLLNLKGNLKNKAHRSV